MAETKKKKGSPKKYRAVVGLTLENGDRVEPGDLYPGTPPTWLVEQSKVKAVK